MLCAIHATLSHPPVINTVIDAGDLTQPGPKSSSTPVAESRAVETTA